MATSGAKRQAAYMERERKKLTDALAEVKELKARVVVLERERDRLGGLLDYVLKQEEWAAAERRRASEAKREAEAAEGDTSSIASKIVVVPAPSPICAPRAHGRTRSPIPPWLMPAP